MGHMDTIFLSGEFDHTLDPKGRVTLPARYREYFNDGVVLVLLPDRDPCISVFRRDSWKQFDAKNVEPLDVFGDEDDRWTQRDIYTKMDEVDPDGQGRVLISAPRIKELGLSGKVKIVGNRTCLEIWNPATLAEVQERRRGGNA